MASGAKRGHAKPGLTLDVAGDGTSDQSFNVTGGVFVKENIAINNTGVMMKDNPKAFTVCTHTSSSTCTFSLTPNLPPLLATQVVPEELVPGEIIGRGASSYVQRATHKPSGTKLALKVLNMFEKSKRDQLIKEVQTLYDANCDWCVSHTCLCCLHCVQAAPDNTHACPCACPPGAA